MVASQPYGPMTTLLDQFLTVDSLTNFFNNSQIDGIFFFFFFSRNWIQSSWSATSKTIKLYRRSANNSQLGQFNVSTMINNFFSITIHGLLTTVSNRYFLFTSKGYAQNKPCQITLALDEHEIYHIYFLIEQELDMHKLCKSSTLIYDQTWPFFQSIRGFDF